MESVISDLLKRFESGGLTRPDLVRALALLTVGGETASAPGFHFSTIVKDPDGVVEPDRRVPPRLHYLTLPMPAAYSLRASFNRLAPAADQRWSAVVYRACHR